VKIYFNHQNPKRKLHNLNANACFNQ
jgi:hypothetical protein